MTPTGPNYTDPIPAAFWATVAVTVAVLLLL